MSDPSRIIAMASAFQESCLLFAAADLGIFTLLSRQPGIPAERVASELGLSERGAKLVLDACAAIGLLKKEKGAYSNSSEAESFLVSGKPGDLSSALRYNRDVYSAWGKVSQLARTGAPVENPGLHLGDDPSRTRAFAMSMHGKALGLGRSALPLIEVSGASQLLDVGGGPGTFSAMIAAQNPDLRCTVLELPSIADIGRELIAQQGMTNQVQFLPGDYHGTAFPDGNDIVLLFGMLHQEPVIVIQDLLRRSFASLRPGGRVYVMDMMTDETGIYPPFSPLFAVNMALTKEHGWVFSSQELGSWATEAGFTGFRVQPLPPPAPHWLAQAIKPGSSV